MQAECVTLYLHRFSRVKGKLVVIGSSLFFPRGKSDKERSANQSQGGGPTPWAFVPVEVFSGRFMPGTGAGCERRKVRFPLYCERKARLRRRRWLLTALT